MSIFNFGKKKQEPPSTTIPTPQKNTSTKLSVDDIYDIYDVEKLLTIVKSTNDMSVLAAAVGQIQDAIDSDTNDEEWRIITDLAMNKEIGIAVTAVKHILRQNDWGTDELLKILLGEGHADARRYLINGIQDQSILKKVATTSTTEGMRYEAVKRLTDKTALKSISVNDKSEWVRRTASQQLQQIG